MLKLRLSLFQGRAAVSRLADLAPLKLPVLGAIPAFEATAGFSLPDDPSPAFEAYGKLVDRVRIPDFHVRGRSIVVTGADAGPGKSAVALNLATLLARAGSKVVLVEADLRLAKRRRIGDGTPSSGFAGLLVNGMRPTTSALVHTLDPKLKLLPVGSVTGLASTLIKSPRLPLVADSLTGLADYVIFDAAPVLDWQETLMLSRRADVTLLVLDAGKTTLAATTNAASSLREVNAGTLGFVLHGAEAWAIAPPAPVESASPAAAPAAPTVVAMVAETPAELAELALEELLANLEEARRMVQSIRYVAVATGTTTGAESDAELATADA